MLLSRERLNFGNLKWSVKFGIITLRSCHLGNTVSIHPSSPPNKIVSVRMSIAGLIVVLFGLSVFGLIETVYETQGVLSNLASRSWPKTYGIILKWDFTESFGGGGSRFHHRLNCLYKYSVNGIEYTNDRITFFALSDEDIVDIGDSVKQGSTHRVFYDPANPKNSVLMRGWSSGMLVIGIVFLVIPLGFLFGLWKTRDVIVQQWKDWPWFSFPK